MTPAQREVVYQSIQISEVEISVNQLFQPMFDSLSQCPHCHKWEKYTHCMELKMMLREAAECNINLKTAFL